MDASLPRSGLSGGVSLTEREQALLEFEARYAGRPAEKALAIRKSLGLGPARYYQLLFALIDEPAALGHDPLLVHRLQRVRYSRLRARRTRPARVGARPPSEDH